MAEYSFPHTSVDGDREITAEMWRAANEAIGFHGWSSGFDCTRDAPSGATFTLTAGLLAVNGVVYITDDDVTVTGTLTSSTNAIIAKAGSDRDVEIIHVTGYDITPPSYDHVLLYLDDQVGTFSLIDMRASNRVAEPADSSITRAKIAETAIQAGTLQRTANFTAGSGYGYTVTFDTPFESVPVVVGILDDNGIIPTTRFGKLAISNVTATGFNTRFEVGPVNVGTHTVRINWIATPSTQTEVR